MVDPGPLRGGPPRAAQPRPARSGVILATHGHPDHVEGLPRFRELAPAGAVVPGRDGIGVMVQGGLRVQPLATPGHTADSVCFIAVVRGTSGWC